MRYERDRYDYVMYHSGYHSLPHYAMGYQPPPGGAAPPPPADPAVLANFEKHWQHYLRNPDQFEALQTSNPAQHANLNNYYRMYGESLRLPPIPSAAAAAAASIKQEPPSDVPSIAEESSGLAAAPSSRASVHSGQSGDGETERRPESRLEQEASTIYPDPNSDPRYQPTFMNAGGKEQVDDNDARDDEAEVAYLATAKAAERMTPAKFSSPHVKAVFGPLGRLAKVDAHAPSLGQSATVELHSLQAVLESQSEELRAFPGPLVPGRTHKGEVIQFCQSKVQAAQSGAADVVDRDSYVLMWELLILLLRQKNAVDGSDIAELLLKGRQSDSSAAAAAAGSSFLVNGASTASSEVADDSAVPVLATTQEKTVINGSQVAPMDQEK